MGGSLIVISLTLLNFHITVSAAELNFNAKAELLENQIDKKQSYFDLLVKPDTEQDLLVELTNDTEKEVTLSPAIYDAVSNSNGVVEYGPNDKKRDPTLVVGLTNIASTQKEIKIPARGTAKLTVKLKMPAKSFSGVILGGLYLKQNSSETNSMEKQQTAIKNEYSYIIGIQLREEMQEPLPAFNLISVIPDQVNARNVIKARIQNSQALLVGNVTITSKIFKKNTKKPIYEEKKSGIELAPNSYMDFLVQLDGNPLLAGDYTATVTLNYQEEYWTWDKDFTITKNVAASYNKKDVSIPKNNNWMIYLGTGIFITIIIFLCLIIVRLKKEKD
ncbi:cell wall surface anchor protein [Enterococcus silesiacus]|nr:cell wall surface anchor protein [Enterococcus silesiacus]